MLEIISDEVKVESRPIFIEYDGRQRERKEPEVYFEILGHERSIRKQIPLMVERKETGQICGGCELSVSIIFPA
jgi:hypothetical protein